MINQIRGLTAEFGITIPQGRYSLQDKIQSILEDAENAVPPIARQMINDL